ncbi:portal protein [Nocardia phage NC1]|nr:portal protein [Nocardia phage NC1]QSL67749.1 portal protein [Nocardia phage P69]
MAVQHVRAEAKVSATAPSLTSNEPPTPDFLLVHMLKRITANEPRWKRLRKYAQGDPPKADTPSSVNDEWAEFEQFRQKARTNYAELVVGACLDRTIILGFRTAAAGDEDGDKEAEKLWDANDMEVRSDRTNGDAFTYGHGYLLADPLSKRAKDFRPWQAHVMTDSVGDPVVALNIEHNDFENRDYAYVWERERDELGMGTGKVYCHIAVRDRVARVGEDPSEIPRGTYMSRNWTWWKTVETPLEMIPLVEFENRDGVGEFERHTDTLDRINHMLLQRVVIATMQAFRQRALKGNFPKYDEKGELIDYDQLFPASPGALWLIPAEAELWESQQTSIQDILASVKDDVRDLAATTRTPMTYFSPDAANGSAEGASLQREGYTSKIDDRKARMAGRWRRFMSLMFQINGDSTRAQLSEIEVIWTPTEVLSLSERYSAASQAGLSQTPLSLKTIMREVLHFSPKQMRAAELERISQALTSAAATPVNGGSGGQTAGGGTPSLTPLQQGAASRLSLASSNGATSRTTGASSGRAGN